MTHFQQLHYGIHLENQMFSQCVIFWQFVSDDFPNFINWNISKKADSIKADQYIWSCVSESHTITKPYSDEYNFLLCYVSLIMKDKPYGLV
jgi:hypothetical protein